MVTDSGKKPETRNHVDTGDGHEALQAGVIDCLHRQTAVKCIEVFTDTFYLPKAAVDSFPVSCRQNLFGEPSVAGRREQVGHRASADQVRMQNRMHLIFEPRPVPNQLASTGELTA